MVFFILAHDSSTGHVNYHAYYEKPTMKTTRKSLDVQTCSDYYEIYEVGDSHCASDV